MSLDDLSEDVQTNYKELGDDLEIALDRETRNELALLTAAFDPEEADELVRRAIHLFFQNTVDRGAMDFQLRSGYDVLYDEYLSGMTFDDMTGNTLPQRDDERRYQF